MAVICPDCRSADTNMLADKYQCLSCGVAFVDPPVKTPTPTKKGKVDA